jgi:hypothetical protein
LGNIHVLYIPKFVLCITNDAFGIDTIAPDGKNADELEIILKGAVVA